MTDPVPVLHAITRMIVGGAQLTALQTAAGLDPRRFRSTLMSGPQLGPEGDLLTRARDQVPVVDVPDLVREIHPWHDLRAYGAIREHLRREPYTIVHTHTSKAGILVRRAARAVRTPVIVHTAHGWQWTHARGSRMNQAIVAAERWAAQWADRIVVVTEKDREKGLSVGVGRPEQYVLIESAIDLSDFSPERARGDRVRAGLGIPADATVFGTVGRFAYQKAPEVMLDAVARLLDRLPSAHFLYVGDGPLRGELERSHRGVFTHPRAHFVGLRDDVADCVAAMNLFLLSSRYEGLPRVVVEAMSLGVPVVSTPADGVVEVVVPGETGELVAHGDAAALASAAEALVGSPDTLRRLGSTARERVTARFGLDRMVGRIAALYEELLEEKRVRASRYIAR